MSRQSPARTKTSHPHGGGKSRRGRIMTRGLRASLSHVHSQCGHFSGSFARILATIAENRVSDATRARSLVKRFHPSHLLCSRQPAESFLSKCRLDESNRRASSLRCRSCLTLAALTGFLQFSCA